MNPDADRLIRTLKGEPRGLTRFELALRLNLTDRATRKLIEATVSAGLCPILTSEDTGEARRYRIAGPNDHESVNRANAEDIKRALSLYAKARGRMKGVEVFYGPSMFLDPIPETPA